MKTLRIHLTQNSAHYGVPETAKMKHTYPLPPPSTVIGAIHDACSFKRYYPMGVSIQGKYGAKKEEFVIHKCFLNSREDDRGCLVKMAQPAALSNAYTKVAKTLQHGSSFKSKKKIVIYDNALLDEYTALVGQKKALSAELKELMAKHKESKSEKPVMDKVKSKQNNVAQQLDDYRVFESIPTYVDTLYEVELVLHISSRDEVINTILENVYSIQSIGRSEDFIDIQSVEIVELNQTKIVESKPSYTAWLNFDDVRSNRIIRSDGKEYRGGTKYYLNRNYTIVDKKREFVQSKCLFASNYKTNNFDESLTLYVDNDNYIVNFI